MAKHSSLNRASGVRVPAGPRTETRDPGSASGRPLRSERSNPGSNPGPGTAPIGDRLMAGRQALTLLVEVRILVPEQLCCATNALCENRRDDDARGRAPPRPQRCPRSRSGDGAWLKSRRCWFDSRRGHSSGWSSAARIDERRFREPEAAGADPVALTNGGVAQEESTLTRGRRRAWLAGAHRGRVREPFEGSRDNR
jgi:hypothetical protein